MFLNSRIAKTFALAAGALLLPIAAHADETGRQSFTRDGVSYVYTVSVQDDQRVLTGTADRIPFRLVVRGGYVSGDFNSRPVQFSLRDVKRTNQEVAVR